MLRGQARDPEQLLTSSFSILRVASRDCSWWYRISNSVCTGCWALTWHTCGRSQRETGEHSAGCTRTRRTHLTS